MSGVKISFEGDLVGWIRENLTHRLARGITGGIAAAVEGMTLDLRQVIEAAGISPVAGRMIGGTVFPRGGVALRAVGSIFSRGRSADAALAGLSEAKVIHVAGAAHLAVPTQYNLAQGHRSGSKGRVLITPEMMASDPKMTFVIPAKNGRKSKLWCIRLTQGFAKGRNGQPQRRAFRGDFHVGQLLGSGRRARVDALLAQGWLPMFVLTPEVRPQKRFDPAPVARRWADRVPDLIERALPNE